MSRSVIAIICIATCFPVVTLGQESPAPSIDTPEPAPPVSGPPAPAIDTPSIDTPEPAPTDEVADPAVPSAKLQEALDMIRRVEELDKLVAEVERLRTENARLREELEKETTTLPLIVVKSKAISATDAMAILEIDDRKLRVRQNSAIMVSIKGGDATPLLVKQITPTSIEIELPDLQRTLVLNE